MIKKGLNKEGMERHFSPTKQRPTWSTEREPRQIFERLIRCKGTFKHNTENLNV